MFNEIEIIHELGGQKKRKFGKVFLIKDNNNQFYTLKKLRKTNSNNLIQEQIRNEKKFDFEHPSLPKVIAFEENNSYIQLVLSFKPGTDLTTYWNSLKKKERLNFYKKLCLKLVPIFQILKEEQIVHADIKPSNIIITPYAYDFDVHLIDFSLAFQTNNPPNRKTLFPLLYASPELILNELNIVDQTSDYYAFGIMSWMLFAGNFPFQHANPSILTNLCITYPLPINRYISKEFQNLLSKLCAKSFFNKAPNQLKKEQLINLLEKGKKDRFQSFNDFSLKIQTIEEKKKWWKIF